jgi:hypothetical protein
LLHFLKQSLLHFLKQSGFPGQSCLYKDLTS